MAKNNLTATSNFVEIADMRGILVLLKEGSLRSVLEVESVNFELKSPDEQIGIIRGFQDFLNALDFNVQIVISSRKLEIGPYLKFLDETFNSLTNELLKIQAQEYMRFVKGLAELANIMDKRFFIVVPYYPIEAGQAAGGSLKDTLKGLLGTVKPDNSISDTELEKDQELVDQRVSLIISALSPLGLKIKVLEQEELTKIYLNYYNQ